MPPTDIVALRARIERALVAMPNWRPHATYSEWATQRDRLLDLIDELDVAEGWPAYRRARPEVPGKDDDAEPILVSDRDGTPGGD